MPPFRCQEDPGPPQSAGRLSRSCGEGSRPVNPPRIDWWNSTRWRMFIGASFRHLGTPMNQTANPQLSSRAGFTEKQGQYLAFIHAYTKLNRRPPAEADMQRYFRVTPPTVHQMIVNLHRAGLIERIPGQPRTIRVLVSPECLPELK